jgi:LPXTG-motif cell wall-anchored protein
VTIGAAVNCVCAVDDVDKLAFFVVEDPECAEADVSVKPGTCEAASSLVLGDTLHATFGEPVIVNGTYTVVATADEGYRFYPGEGVSEDGFEKTFEGTLPAQPTVCGDLTTLSLPNTGAGMPEGALWLGLTALGLGVAGVFVASRRAAAKR